MRLVEKVAESIHWFMVLVLLLRCDESFTSQYSGKHYVARQKIFGNFFLICGCEPMGPCNQLPLRRCTFYS